MLPEELQVSEDEERDVAALIALAAVFHSTDEKRHQIDETIELVRSRYGELEEKRAAWRESTERKRIERAAHLQEREDT